MKKKELKKYLDIDVYTMAKKRIEHVINSFDTVLVAFSGGKDSLCALNLVKEVYSDLGINEKVKVFFRDEELIPDHVIDFVQKIAESGEYDFRYYAIPLKAQKFILGNNMEYIQFDPTRAWLRNPPPYAIRLKEGDRRIFSQYEADEFICKDEKGRVAIINGIRADESLIRLRSCLNKKNENYINATENKRIKFVKPIYDWSEKDVFLYFYQKGIKYCEIYDNELFNGEQLRVSTPLHAESSKRFNKIRTRDPKFYQQLVNMFPEMLVQERYWNEFDRKQDFGSYPHTYNGLRQYIADTISNRNQRELALKRVEDAYNRREKCMAEGQIYNLGGYPLLFLFEQVSIGGYKRVFQSMQKNIPYRYFEFEGLSRQQYEESRKNIL